LIYACDNYVILHGDKIMLTQQTFKLTERQQREREYYEEFSQMRKIIECSFDPVLGKEKRPWNSYWFVYEFVLQNYNPENCKLLDFGCGAGISSVRFAKIGYEVWGFDIASNNIAIAENLAKKYKFDDRTYFSVQTAEQLKYPSEFFDIIVGIDILHHVDINQAITECSRILKKDGIAIFREHIEVPILDRIRNTRIVKYLVPKGKSFEHQITEDERKLTANDILIINKVFPKLSTQRFTFLSRLKQFIPKPKDGRSLSLEKIDYFLLKTFSFLKHFGGSIVLILAKKR